MKKNILTIILIASSLYAGLWNPNLPDSQYRNPVLYSDYSDPDVIRVGDDFFMTASSFNCVPGLPILLSKDLVNWRLVNYALPQLSSRFDEPRPGDGVWAPSIRYREGLFYIYYGDPDSGIYQVKTKDLFGVWDEPVLVKSAYGNIDPCPFWDDDGSVYLVHAFAHSRAGVKSLLQINQLSADGTRVLDKGTIVFDGHQQHPTIEGPKLYKRNGYYYIFAPAGGVKEGWQTVLRSKSIFGPYENKIVLGQGETAINGPHQGAWVELETGESWFLHFQENGPWGRIVHLQPMEWKNDWPVIGNDSDGDGTGEPALQFRKPGLNTHEESVCTKFVDTFERSMLDLNWQWYANPAINWFSVDENAGTLRLYAVSKRDPNDNLWHTPNLLLQKFPSPEFTAVAEIRDVVFEEGCRAGLVVMGLDYGTLTIRPDSSDFLLEMSLCLNSEEDGKEKVKASSVLTRNEFPLILKVHVDADGNCQFYFEANGRDQVFGPAFSAKPGKWIGAKVGLFCESVFDHDCAQYAEFQKFEIN